MSMATLQCLLILSAAAAADIQLVSLVPSNKTLTDHHTNQFRMQNGFVLRRGQPFDLEVTFDAAVTSPTFEFFNDDEAYGSPDFSVSASPDNAGAVHVVTVSSAIDAPVGKYTKMKLVVKHSAGQSEFELQAPMYLLVNAWNSDEKLLFVPEEKRQEYLLNEYGSVWQGSLEAHEETMMYYGQFDQLVLDALFHVLDHKLNRNRAGDPIAILQTISQWQGIVTLGKITVGDANAALLEGNWFGPFNDSNEPTHWSSVTDILKRWRSTGKAAQFGQCFTFAALQNALARCLGVASRQISAFGARVDATNMRDPKHRFHHQVNQYFDENGKSVYMEGMVWNFHSWNEVYVNEGFACLDGTPSGSFVGPAPTKAVLANADEVEFNVSFEISTVHATVNNFIVKCEGNHSKKDKLKGCTVLGQTSMDKSGVHLVTTSKTLPNGTCVKENITDQFVDATLNPERPWPSAVRITPKTYSVTVGEDVVGSVDLDTTELKQGEYVQVNMRFTLETYTGEEVKDVMQIQQRVLVKGHQISLPWTIDRDSYVTKFMNDGYLRMSVVASGSDGKFYMDQRVMSIDTPWVRIEGPEKIKIGASNVVFTAKFTNPLDFPLEEACVTVHSYGLRFADQPSDVTEKQICTALGATEDLDVDVHLVAPSETGVYHILATVAGDYLPSATGYHQVEAVEHLVGFSAILIAALALLGCAVVAAIACVCVRRRRSQGVHRGTDGMGASLQMGSP